MVALPTLFGFSYITSKFSEIFVQLTRPFGTTRWALTVAESHQPYFVNWAGEMGWLYLTLFFAGAIILFYTTIKPVQKKVWHLTFAFSAFIILLVTSRYSPSSILNGENLISSLAYIGSIIAFVALLVYCSFSAFYKDKETFKKISTLNPTFILMLLWFFFVLLGARSAIRLMMVLAPVTTIMVSYLAFKSYDYAFTIKQKVYTISILILLALVLFSPFGFATRNNDHNGLLVQYYLSSSSQARYTGLSYNSQWQRAMDWVRMNTPEDAIFAHWWDYGYWVQTGSGRKTLSDGGNARDAINYFIGRHVLTAHSEREALELLKANNATNLLMISDEIGKYPAFSSIGSDANYDRYSWIPTFTINPQMTQETRNETVYIYMLGTPLDHDFIYNEMLFPAGSAGIAAIAIPFNNLQEAKNKNNLSALINSMQQPLAVIVYGGNQYKVPIECMFIEGKELTFKEKGLSACLRMIPEIDPSTNQVKLLTAGLYLSPEVRQTLFTKLFLFGQESEYFKLVYSDENAGAPIALYGGRLIGPLKIWNISYPNDLVIPPEYYGVTLPDPKVQEVRR